ncbi:hypothetical protein, partial [Komagataeibacter saccharivorans]|uniref:hypothetical protein n=1 Tax=Komagataeibacter saccharivorans TaxID=265959 RepID=UPI0039E91B4F
SDTAAGVNPGRGVGQQQRKIGGIATSGDSLFNPQICPNKWGHLCHARAWLRTVMLADPLWVSE